jgi:UDP-3-O-[3-hydroxymyristoyl] glucosamine N-acyltransferase
VPDGPVWDGVVRFRAPARLSELARRFGGEVSREGGMLHRVAPAESAGDGDLAPLVSRRYFGAAEQALARGALLLVDASLAKWLPEGALVWLHEHAMWALASVLGECEGADVPPSVGEGGTRGANVVLEPRVVVGRNVRIGAGAVIGAPGFGWATGPSGETVRIPQLGGVVIEDDVEIGPLCTIDAGTLSPTRVGRGAKLDAQVHVGHNAEIGEGTIVAAQSGFAGSVRIGRGVLVGGQVGVADHVHVGDGARIAAKSGVIGDVPGGAVVAGYPAVARGRWLRALARLYRLR